MTISDIFSLVIIVYIREKGKEIQRNESMERDHVGYLLIDSDCKTVAVPLPAGFLGVMRADFMSQMPEDQMRTISESVLLPNPNIIM